MAYRMLLTTLSLSLTFFLSPAESWGRGFGGGRSFGGGGRSFGGGGFGGGRSFGGGGFGGGRSFGGGGGFGGGGRSFAGAGGLGGSGPSFGGSQGRGLGGGRAFGEQNRGAGALGGGGFNRGGAGQGAFDRGGLGQQGGGFGARGAGAQGFGGNRSQPVSRGQLNSFLGLPSDGGLHNLGGSGQLGSQLGSNVDVNRGAVAGPRGGYAAGATVTGPQGNTAGRAAAVGPEGGVEAARGVQGAGGTSAVQRAAVGPGGTVAAGGAVTGPAGNTAGRAAAVGPYGGTVAARGVQGAGGASAVQAAGVGPRGTVAAGGAVRGPYGGEAARGVVAGPGGAAAGFARVSPSGLYSSATAVRSNYHAWGVYGAGWYTSHPGAWYAAGWASGAAWRAATWGSVGSWMSYYPAQPVYYNYGTNVTYQNNDVYVNGQDAGTAEQYYDQAANLANEGTQADAPTDGQWLPLGVFALSQSGHTKTTATIQLAVNKQGIIRGNYTDDNTGQTQVVQGSVDKQTQRVAFTIGDNTTNVIETGLYNLTKDEAPALYHFGKDRTEQWLLVRLKNPNASDNSGASN